MILAGHCPTKQFTLKEWQAMHIHERGKWAMPGLNRSLDDRGKPIVIYIPFMVHNAKDKQPFYIARPVVRVPMRKSA